MSVDLPKPRLAIRPHTQDTMAYKGVLLENEYRLPDKFSPDDLILDVGAQVGCFAVACLERGCGKVVCYEPDPENCALLRRNLAAYDPERYEVYEAAVWRSDRPFGSRGLLQVPGAYTAMHHVMLDPAHPAAAGCIEVPALPLDAELTRLAGEWHSGRVRLLKLDCEGSEYPILLSSRRLDLIDAVTLESHAVERAAADPEAFAGLPLTADALTMEPGPELLCRALTEHGFTRVESFVNPDYDKNSWVFAAREKARRPVKVCFFRFPYGNTEHPDQTDWLIATSAEIQKDWRVSDVSYCHMSDTPITMCRNVAAKHALESGADLMVMLDNDIRPDLGQGASEKNLIPGALPFWKTSFDHWWEHNHPDVSDVPSMIGAPYCGPPPHCNVYVFLWRNRQNDTPDPELFLRQYEREESVLLTGIKEVAALPTGLILIDTRVFKVLADPYFYYEFPDSRAIRKLSTEDVTFTRDASLQGCKVYCNWDSWAGHWKKYLVGKPRALGLDEVPWKFRQACDRIRTQGPEATPGQEYHRAP